MEDFISFLIVSSVVLYFLRKSHKNYNYMHNEEISFFKYLLLPIVTPISKFIDMPKIEHSITFYISVSFSLLSLIAASISNDHDTSLFLGFLSILLGIVSVILYLRDKKQS